MGEQNEAVADTTAMSTVSAAAAALATPGPGPAAGAAAAMTAALAAGLAGKVAHSAGEQDTVEELARLRVTTLHLADQDTAAFTSYLAARRAARTTPDTPDTAEGADGPDRAERDRVDTDYAAACHAIVEVPLTIAESAARMLTLVAGLKEAVPPALDADAATASTLATAAARSAAAIVRANIGQGNAPGRDRIEALIDQVERLGDRSVS